MARLRRFHLDIRPVPVTIGARQVTFVGLTFHARAVMLEYEVLPPLHRTGSPFGPTLG